MCNGMVKGKSNIFTVMHVWFLPKELDTVGVLRKIAFF